MSETNVPKRARVVVIGGGSHRLLRRLSPGPHGLERRGPARARPAHLGHHLARRRADGDLRLDVGDVDRDAQVHARSLRRLEAETGQSTGLQAGRLHRGRHATPDRLEEYRRVSAFNRYCGVDVHEISPAQVKELFPLARTDDILAGFYVKEDGRANPVDVTMALAKGARMQGATILEGVPVTGVLQQARRRSPACETAHGDIEAEYVVNCAGMWARQLGAKVGRQHPAPGGRALLPHHREDRRASSQVVAGARGSRLATATSARRSAA